MTSVTSAASMEPLRANSFGQRSGSLYTPWEPRPTKREQSFQRTRPRTPNSPRSVGLACTSRQQKLRNNAGEVFFPHAVRFDVPLGLNARPPGSPGTATEGRRRRVAHANRLESGWTSPRKCAVSKLPTVSTSSPRTARTKEEISVTTTTRDSHTGAVTLKLNDDEKQERELQQIFHQIREQMHSSRKLYGETVTDARTLFKQADRDNSGTLDRWEFSETLERLGLGLAPGQIAMVCEFMDTDGNDSMDYSEFILHLVVGDDRLEEEEAARRKISIHRLRAAAWEVRLTVGQKRRHKSEEMQRQIHLAEIQHQRKKTEQTVNRIKATNEHKREAASLKRQASVLAHDGDYGGAMATLERVKALTPQDPTIKMQEDQLKLKMAKAQEPPPPPAAGEDEVGGEGSLGSGGGSPPAVEKLSIGAA